jgi:hypothetical protein
MLFLLLRNIAGAGQAAPGQTVRMNVTSVGGVAPGYAPTAAGGLALAISAGTSLCAGAVQGYAGGTLTMIASATNYVYLDPSANCAPATNTTGFNAGAIPIATVVTNASAITGVSDRRTVFATGIVASTAPPNQFATGVSPSGVLAYSPISSSNLSDGPSLERTGNKNQANGYAGLNASSQVAASQIPLFGASGAGHGPGAVPDPGASAGTTHYLREDATWVAPPASAPGGAAGAVEYTPDGSTFSGDATNFSYDAVGHNLSVGGAIAAGAFKTSGSGPGSTQWASGPLSPGQAGTVLCGANASNQFACSSNGGAVTPVPWLAADLGGNDPTNPQVVGLHLTGEGQLGNQALSSSVPNDPTTGTTQYQLAYVNSSGNAVNCGTSNTNVLCYPVASPTANGANARLARSGAAVVKGNTAGYAQGDFVGADTTTAGTGKDLGATVSAIPAGTCVTGVAATSAAPNSNGTVLVDPFCVPAGAAGFGSITSGTNTSATMTLGSGATISFAGSGVVNASQYKGGSASGTGACGPNTFASALNDAAAPTCAPAVTASSAPANQFAAGISAAGALVYAQPGFAGIASGTNTSATLTVGNGATLNAAAGGVVDLTGLSANSFKLPSSAGYAPTTEAAMGWDTSQHRPVVGDGSETLSVPRVLCAVVPTSDTLSASTTSEQVFSTKCSLPANLLIANKALRVQVGLQTVASSSPPSMVLKARLEKAGPVEVYFFTSAGATPGPSATRNYAHEWLIGGTGAPSTTASVNVAGQGVLSAIILPNNTPSPITLDTTALQQIEVTVTFAAVASGNWAQLTHLILEEIN